jgi:hypothetical protein
MMFDGAIYIPFPGNHSISNAKSLLNSWLDALISFLLEPESEDITMELRLMVSSSISPARLLSLIEIPRIRFFFAPPETNLYEACIQHGYKSFSTLSCVFAIYPIGHIIGPNEFRALIVYCERVKIEQDPGVIAMLPVYHTETPVLWDRPRPHCGELCTFNDVLKYHRSQSIRISFLFTLDAPNHANLMQLAQKLAMGAPYELRSDREQRNRNYASGYTRANRILARAYLENPVRFRELAMSVKFWFDVTTDKSTALALMQHVILLS